VRASVTHWPMPTCPAPMLAPTPRSQKLVEATACAVERMGAHGGVPKPEGMHRDEGQLQQPNWNRTTTWKAQRGQYRKPQKATHRAWLDAPIPDPRIYGPSYVACMMEETTDPATLYSPGSAPTHLPSSNGDNDWVDVGCEALTDFRYSHTPSCTMDLHSKIGEKAK
jgi:hypothetical protein